MSRTRTRWLAPVALALLALPAAAQDKGQTAVARQALVLDGKFCGYVVSAEGGNLRGEVTTVRRSDTVLEKHVTRTAVTPLVVELRMPLQRPLLAWIGQSMTGKARAAGVQLTAYDANDRAIGGRLLREAQLTALTLGPLDARSKSAATLMLEIAASRVDDAPGGGSAPASSKTPVALQSLFRLSLGDLPTTRVAKISGLSWRRPVSASSTDARSREPALGVVEIGDVQLRLPLADAAPWTEWFRRSVVQGKGEERSGRLELLAQDRKSVLQAFELSHVGIFALDTTGDGSARDASLYLEGIALSQ